MNFNVFISYHRRDTKKMRTLKKILSKSDRVNCYSVDGNLQLDGLSHQQISQTINQKLKHCNVVLNIVGMETYKRTHVEHELNAALRGGVGKRKGIVVVLLDERGDTRGNLSKETLSNRIYENYKYAVICNEGEFKQKFLRLFKKAVENSNNNQLNVIHNQNLPKFKRRKYYDN